MYKQMKYSFDDDSIVEDNRIKSFYEWCIKNNKTQLLEEWDYEKNKNITPQNTSFGTDKKVWWIVYYKDKNDKEFAFSWQDTVAHRKSGRGCPYLSNPTKKIYIGFNDLATTHPDLAKEMDLEENRINGVTPYNITYGSSKKIFWFCKIHGLYKASASERIRGYGCPYCSGKQIKKGFNDLATTHPLIAAEWDYEKNDIGPDAVSKGCIHKYWWKCDKGHSFAATPNSRTSKNTGCPICANKIILKGYNDLATTNPELLKEWNYRLNGDLMPDSIAPKSNKVVWWICQYGHEYQARVCRKTLDKTRCPICNRERQTSFLEKAICFYLKSHFTDIQENTKFSWLGKMEIDIYLPSLKVGIEYDGYYWHQSIDKDLKKDKICEENGVSLIRIRDDSCPRYKSNSTKIYVPDDSSITKMQDAIQKLINLINDKYNISITIDVDLDRDYSTILNNYISYKKDKNLLNERPDLAAEWDYDKNKDVLPEFVSTHSNRPYWWICPKCHSSYKLKVSDRTGSKHSNCPICAGKRIVKGINDLGTTNPELLKEWDFEKNTLSPYSVSKGTHRKAWWCCEHGHSWEASIYSRASGVGCPYCAHQKADHNSFAELYPELLEEWDYNKNERDPYTLLPQSNLKFWWKCKKCGYEWLSTVDHRTIRHGGCPLCAHQVLVKGINDLETQFPEVAKEWNYEKNKLLPSDVSGGTNKKYWWKCSKCGYEWECVVASRTKRGSKCPNCRKK